MTDSSFYSDRLNGLPPRTLDALPGHTKQGLLSLIDTKIDTHWFAQKFPEQCGDGNGVAGTNTLALTRNLQALIPDAPWPLLSDPNLGDEVVFDLIEYSAERVAEPAEGMWHSYYRHYELGFNRDAGQAEFRHEVNQIFQRGRVMYELTFGGQVHRLGTPEVQDVLRRLVPDSGGGRLDALINEARERYSSFKAEERAIGLERLWDAFERLKTIDVPGGSKKASIEVLLQYIPDEPWRAIINAEMAALTDIGNNFGIRHFETRTTAVPSSGADYLFGRMGMLIGHLLEQSHRLSERANL